VVIKFGTAYAAEQCVKLMNGRFFGGRKLASFYWDGATDYTKAVWVERRERPQAASEGEGAASEGGPQAEVVEADEDEEKRLDEFGDYLDSQVSTAATFVRWVSVPS
jgi:HIV Tat-specific factor 1